MKTNKIKLSELRPQITNKRVLPNGFIQRVINYKEKLKEVEGSSLEQTIDNFQRDLDPEMELRIWEEIADLYQYKVVQKWSIERKIQLFKELLCPPPFEL